MKILLVNKFYYLSGGAERYVQLWSRLLRQRGHELIPFAMQDPRNWPTPYARYFARSVYFDPASEPPHLRGARRSPLRRARFRAALRSIYSLDAARRISRLVRDSRPDIVHLHSYCYQLTASILPAIRAAGLPVIQTAHEYKHVCANQHLYNQRTGQICEACRGGRWYAPVLTRCLKGSRAAGAVACVESLLDRALAMRRRHIDRIIAPSHFLRAKLIEFGWPPHRIQRVPNFVFPEDFNPSRPAEPYFLFVGRLVAHKGVRALLRALRRLPEARLLVAGDGPLRAEVERATGELAGRLRWLGFVQEETLRMLLERCLAVVVPSEWYENCPYSILEALAAGRPVVASRIGGIPELVAHGRNGLLFAPGDEDELVERLAFLWQHREEAARMGREGRGLIEARYSPEVHYEAMAPVMRGLT